MPNSGSRESENLWLARTLWDMGAVRFGDFTIGRSTVHSPVYVNPRLLISKPTALRRSARVLVMETTFEMARRRQGVSPFDLVAGVPFGGLHLATAFSLITRVPMIYVYPSTDNDVRGTRYIEGRHSEGQSVLVVDDLVTTGGSIIETLERLRGEGLLVRDAVVLIDRGQGARERLRQHGCNLHTILSLEVMLNYYLSTGKITEALHRKCIEYLKANKEG